MTNQISIYNHETGTNIVRDMTDEELAQAAADNLASKETENMIANMAAAKQAVLDKLGLNQNEAQALLG